MDRLPFKEIKTEGKKRRVFNENVNDSELKWHYDTEDRNVEILQSNGWKFQMDNGLPVDLVEGETISIPKYTYHRVIKGVGDLVVLITEKKDSDEFAREEDLIRSFIKTFKPKIGNDDNFIGFEPTIVADENYGTTLKLYGLFKEPFTGKDSDVAMAKGKELLERVKKMFPFVKTWNFYSNSTSTLYSFRRFNVKTSERTQQF